MRILVISPRIPLDLTDGAWLVIYNIYKHLAVNNDVYLLALHDGSADENMVRKLEEIFTEVHLVKKDKPSGSPKLRYVKDIISSNSGLMMRQQTPQTSAKFKEKMESLVSVKNIDILNCHLLKMAEFGLDNKKCAKVLHLIDSETLRIKRLNSHKSWWQRLWNWPDLVWYHRLKNYERNTIKHFDACITVGKRDYAVLKKLSPGAHITLIPNGVDSNYFKLLPEVSKENPTILFFGNMKTPPNKDAIHFFYQEILPIIRIKLQKAHLYIVGSNPTDDIKILDRDSHVTVTGFVDDLRDYAAKADVVISPMRKGGGIKNKILESMSMGRVVVSTTLGAEGINVRNGENILIGDSPAEFADRVIEVIRNKDLRNKIIKNARKLIAEEYSWDKCAAIYERLYENILSERTH